VAELPAAVQAGLEGTNIEGLTFAQLLKRPAVTIEAVAAALVETMAAQGELEMWAEAEVAVGHLPVWVRNEMKTVETEIKYAGYLDQQRKSMEKLKKAEQKAIPAWFDYTAVSGLSREMQEKLGRVRPQTLGQASRISGVTPAAVSLIHVYIEIQGRQQTVA
jgi:tRNA uridine 5-carboxymethylaminomethyl modification enzyme